MPRHLCSVPPISWLSLWKPLSHAAARCRAGSPRSWIRRAGTAKVLTKDEGAAARVAIQRPSARCSYRNGKTLALRVS